MCLSPIPWMLCSPKPFSIIVGHSSASTATIRVPNVSFRPVAGADRAGRPGRRHERREPQPVPAVDDVEDMFERAAGDLVVPEVVAELAELVEHDVAGVAGQLVAGVVDLLDVGLGARRADDVVGRVLAPPVEPVEALLAHPFGKDGDAAAGHDPADGDAATGVVAGRGPDRAVAGRVELAGDDPRREAGVRGQHLVRGDHREAIAEHDDDRALDARQRRWQDDVLGHVDPTAGEVVVPVDPPQVAGVGSLRISIAEAVVVDRRRVGELGERRQADAALAEPADAVGERLRIDDAVGESELPLQRVDDSSRVVGRLGARADVGVEPGAQRRRALHVSRTLSIAFAVCIQRAGFHWRDVISPLRRIRSMRGWSLG